MAHRYSKQAGEGGNSPVLLLALPLVLRW